MFYMYISLESFHINMLWYSKLRQVQKLPLRVIGNLPNCTIPADDVNGHKTMKILHISRKVKTHLITGSNSTFQSKLPLYVYCHANTSSGKYFYQTGTFKIISEQIFSTQYVKRLTYLLIYLEIEKLYTTTHFQKQERLA